MVQENLENIKHIYLNLFRKEEINNLEKFIDLETINNQNILEQYDKNLRILKLLASQSENILEINCFYNLPSIALMAGNPKKIYKISKQIDTSYYELINYIDNIELHLYEEMQLNFKFYELNFDLLYVNNYLQCDKDYYDNIFKKNNINIKKYIMIDGVDDYFIEMTKYLMFKNKWQIYCVGQDKFNFLILKNSIIN